MTHLMIAGGIYLLLLALILVFNHGAHRQAETRTPAPARGRDAGRARRRGLHGVRPGGECGHAGRGHEQLAVRRGRV